MDNTEDFFDYIRGLQTSEQPEVDKLKEFFGRVTGCIVAYGEKELELARAMQDREALVKVQIKLESVKTARAIFARGYRIATGKAAWDEQDQR